MAISGVGQSYYQNNVATTKSTKSVNSTGETGNTKELSEAEEMAIGHADEKLDCVMPDML